MPTPVTLTDNARRWLNMIRTAEGSSYDTAFSGRRFDPNQPHPGTVYHSRSGYASAAHGAYQFMPDTWVEINGGRNLPMTPANQDQAALRLMQRAGVDPNATITPERVARLSGTWASLPNAQGRSAYRQPVKSYAQLRQVFDSFEPASSAPRGSFDSKKVGPRYQPNSSAGPVVVARMPAPALRDPVRKTPPPGFTPQVRPNDLSGPTVSRQIGGLPGLNDIAQAAIGNLGAFRNRASTYGAAVSQLDTFHTVSRSYGTSLDLGSTLQLTPALTAAASGGTTWSSTAVAANAWRTGFGV